VHASTHGEHRDVLEEKRVVPALGSKGVTDGQDQVDVIAGT